MSSSTALRSNNEKLNRTNRELDSLLRDLADARFQSRHEEVEEIEEEEEETVTTTKKTVRTIKTNRSRVNTPEIVLVEQPLKLESQHQIVDRLNVEGSGFKNETETSRHNFVSSIEKQFPARYEWRDFLVPVDRDDHEVPYGLGRRHNPDRLSRQDEEKVANSRRYDSSSRIEEQTRSGGDTRQNALLKMHKQSQSRHHSEPRKGKGGEVISSHFFPNCKIGGGKKDKKRVNFEKTTTTKTTEDIRDFHMTWADGFDKDFLFNKKKVTFSDSDLLRDLKLTAAGKGGAAPIHVPVTSDTYWDRALRKPRLSIKHQEHQEGRASPSSSTSSTSAHVCSVCQLAIEGRCVTALYRKFHPEHFVCSYCLRQLSQGTFKERGDKPYCQGCFDRLYRPN